MVETSLQSDTMLEVIAPDDSRQEVAVTLSPFLIGRGEVDNTLPLSDGRISRKCAAIVAGKSGYQLEDRGNRYGVFVNGAKVEHKRLRDGDVITFGIDGGYQIVFRSTAVPAAAEPHTSVANLLTRIGTLSDLTGPGSSSGLNKLNLLLEATSLLHSQLPLESVLGTMLDHAIAVTHADRGLLIEPDDSGTLRVHLARSNKGESLPPRLSTPARPRSTRLSAADPASLLRTLTWRVWT